MSQIALFILVGICLYACINHLIFGFRSPVNRSRLLFAVLSILAAGFAVCEAMSFQQLAVAGFVVFHRIGMGIALLFFMVLPWFAQWYMPVYQRQTIIGFNVVFSALLLVNLIRDNGFYYSNIHSLQQRTLPWGEQISYLQADVSGLGDITWLFFVAMFVYLLYGCFQQRNTAQQAKAGYFAASLMAFMVLASSDVLIDYGYLDFMRLGVFGVLALIVSMSFTFSLTANQNVKQLREKETHLRLALQAANIGTWDLDLNTNKMTWAKGADHLFGLPPGEFGGTNDAYMNLLRPADAERMRAAIRRALDEGAPCYFEHILVWPDGSEHWLACRGEVGRDVDGKPVHIRGTVMDITERKRNEQAIGEIAAGVSAETGEAFFIQLVLHLAKLFNADYAFVGVLSGAANENVETIAVCAHGEITENLCYALAGTPCENVVTNCTFVCLDNAQEQFPDDKLLTELDANSYIGTPLHDASGAVMGVMVVLDRKPLSNIENITEILLIFATRVSAELARIKSERRLRDAEQRLRLHVKQTPLGVIEWDTEFRVTDWNDAAEKIFGYTRSEAVGESARDLILQPASQTRIDEVWKALLENKGGTRNTNDNVTKDGSVISCEWYNTPLVTDDDQVIGVASLVQDITDRVQAQKDLASHRDQLEELVLQRTSELETANRELESFSYSVSHDLRTPLRSINGFSQALLEDYQSVLDETGQDYLWRLINASERMAHLIDDLLELSRLGRTEMTREQVNISKLAEYSMARLREENPGREVTSTIEADVMVSGDARLLGVVMDNLLDNAWKYTGKKKQANIEFASVKTGDNTVYFVRDDGAGFDMRYTKKLFGAFQRLHRSEDFEGTGIGLATVQRLVHRHGGTVWAEGEIDNGATFYFTLSSNEA